MLEIRNLSKSFTMHIRGGVVLPSFSDVSFGAASASLLAITGPSGVGKSSLLKCIYRTYIPSSGEILYTPAEGEPVDLASAEDWKVLSLRRREIGYVSQFFQVMPRVPALEILSDPLISRGVNRDEALDRSRDMLSRVGLGKTLWDMYPSTFSGGEKQRLNILHAIITRPRLLLLDEPTASLDRGYKEKIIDMLLALKAEGTAMVGVFHDRDALLALSDTRYDLVHGEYCAIDT
ncbi:phosphonate C-P lyase system protein PhnL [Spirochaetia bacterium]|nr:phosphonate C-P lyase system protein PhnL [Spirochaetia bacterium]